MGGAESGVGEFSVGSIVWVRRRNGSWWPGKIVGPEELSASHLTSPRTGTPVKLLGREDASVDWYNLEKSKRVKAFRCGDFDDCIRRAESSQGMPIKKREKYARREDAILHALELEKQQIKKQGKLGIASDCTNHKSSGGAVKKGSVTPQESLDNNKRKLGNSKSIQICKRLEVSPKTEILDSPLCSKMPKDGNQLSGEEDHSEALPRMRGLQDFGLKIAPSATLSSFVASNGSRKSVVDNTVEASLSGGAKIGSSSHMNGKKSLDKRKRSHEESGEENLVKRRDKRRPLVQVLQSSAKLEEVPHLMEPDSAAVSTSVSGVLEPIGAFCRAKRSRCVYFQADSSESLDHKAVSHSDIEMSDSQNEPFPHPISLIEQNISASSEDESDSLETESTESESDSSETEDMDEETATHSDAAVPMDPDVSSMGRYESQEHGSTGREDPDESMLSGDMPHFYSHYPSSAHEAVSKWQLKGKRNIRNLTKRSANTPYPEEKDFRGDVIGLDNGYSSSRAVYRGRNLIEWYDWSWEDHQPSTRGYWDIKRERFDPVYDARHQFRGRSRSMLIDVEVKVQASYQKEPVPIVSLMSKLNGKAIIGHPIQIEALDNGSSANLLSTVDDYGNELIENDGNGTLPQAWRTARRTANFRVPRPQLSSALDGDEAAYDFPFLDRENKPSSKKSNAHKGSPVKRNNNAPHNHGLLPDGKFKKAPKKVGLSSSQKTRTLSSIAIEHSFSNINKLTTRDSSSSIQMDVGGLMKTDSSGGPTTVACIPVKLVFSRLLEKINRPASKAVSAAASSNEALLNSNLERNPS